MTAVALHALPLTAPALPAVADWLLARRPATRPQDLASVLVLLPSQRACDQLGHVLFEKCGEPALVLPRIMTPQRLADHLATLLDGDEPDSWPAQSLRPLALAFRLTGLDWLRDRPEAALGLATELIALFDELRLAGREELVLDEGGDEALLAQAEIGAEEAVLADLERLRAAWRSYRDVLPQDQIDRRLKALAAAGRRWPGVEPSLVVAAHLGRLDRSLAGLLRQLAAAGVPVHWLTAGAADQRSHLLLSTYRDSQADAHPLREIGQNAERLGGQAPPVPVFAAEDLPARLANLSEARRQLAPEGAIQLRSCRDPEHESRVAAAAVMEALAAAQAAGGPVPTILVATADRELAARIAAQLRDAGLDVDDSRGRPLISLPAGRLLRDILRTVAAGWPFESLLEVLTHPYVRLTAAGERPGHAVRIQLLEAAIRGSRTARRGLPALLALTAEADRKSAEGPSGWSLRGFVSDIAARFAPLTDLGRGPVPWSRAIEALAASWSALAPDRPLVAVPDPQHGHDDRGAAADLLAALATGAACLPRAPLSEIAATITELLAGPVCEVRPLTRRYLPVRLVGLVEARLETADLLVVAGMGQDTFPGRLARPLLLPDRLRRALELRHWRREAGSAAELFLRLLHVAPRMLITWPTEKDGRPVLPSPLVQRLALAAGGNPLAAAEPALRRRRLPAMDALRAAEARFRREPEPIPAPLIPPPQRLSHTALQMYRECPYKFLLADRLKLRRTDPLATGFTAADAGTLAHRAMQRWLVPESPGWAALAERNGPAALACLREAAEAAADDLGVGLPGGAVVLQSLLAMAPALVAIELDRAGLWQPAACEAKFAVTLGQAAAWLREMPGEPPPHIPEALADLQLVGTIDRVDRRRDGAPAAAVLDYKTGQLPSKIQVQDGRQLQIVLYALAVESGTVAGLPALDAGVWRLDHGGFYSLSRRQPGLPERPHLTERTDLAAGVRSILAQALAICHPQTGYALVPDWQAEEASGQIPCRVCEFRGICRLEERDTTPALAGRLAAVLTENPRGGP